MMRRAAAYIAFFISALQACGQKTFDEKLESLYNHTVPVIAPEALFELQKEASGNLFILDTRSEEEYKVSFIHAARFVSYKNFNRQDVSHIPKDAKVVVYCSVGYRSEKIGEKLTDMGYKDVLNLYGGIFLWKNKGNKVFNHQNMPTDSVHTYNKSWSKWLKTGTKVY